MDTTSQAFSEDEKSVHFLPSTSTVDDANGGPSGVDLQNPPVLQQESGSRPGSKRVKIVDPKSTTDLESDEEDSLTQQNVVDRSDNALSTCLAPDESTLPNSINQTVDNQVSAAADKKKTKEERKKEREKKKEEEMLKKYQAEQEAKQRISAKSKCGRWIKHNLKIGEGGYKFVYRGYDSVEARNVAWCEFKREHVDTKEKRQAMFKETEIMLKMNHPHIVRCFDVFREWIDMEDPNNQIEEKGLVIIQELMGEGTLKSVIRKNFLDGQCILKFPLITRWWHQILDALRYMHHKIQPPILHRDLKAENCFLYGASDEAYLNVKVGDFGLATHVNNSGRRTMLGTLGFMAPEIFDEKYDEKVDIYAFGMMMLQVMTNRTPYDECETVLQVAAKTMSGQGPDIMQMVSNPLLCEVITACIQPLTCFRPTADELYFHPLFQPKTLPVEVEPNYDNATDRAEVLDRFVRAVSNSEMCNPNFNLRLRFRDKKMLQELGLDDGESLEFDLDIYKAEDQDIPDLIHNLRLGYEDKLSRVFENPKQPDKKIVSNHLDKLFNSIKLQMQFSVKVLLGKRWKAILDSLVQEKSNRKKQEGSSIMDEDDESDGEASDISFTTIGEYKSKWNKAKKMLDKEIQAYRNSTSSGVHGATHVTPVTISSVSALPPSGQTDTITCTSVNSSITSVMTSSNVPGTGSTKVATQSSVVHPEYTEPVSSTVGNVHAPSISNPAVVGTVAAIGKFTVTTPASATSAPITSIVPGVLSSQTLSNCTPVQTPPSTPVPQAVNKSDPFTSHSTNVVTSAQHSTVSNTDPNVTIPRHLSELSVNYNATNPANVPQNNIITSQPCAHPKYQQQSNQTIPSDNFTPTQNNRINSQTSQVDPVARSAMLLHQVLQGISATLEPNASFNKQPSQTTIPTLPTHSQQQQLVLAAAAAVAEQAVCQSSLPAQLVNRLQQQIGVNITPNISSASQSALLNQDALLHTPVINTGMLPTVSTDASQPPIQPVMQTPQTASQPQQSQHIAFAVTQPLIPGQVVITNSNVQPSVVYTEGDDHIVDSNKYNYVDSISDRTALINQLTEVILNSAVTHMPSLIGGQTASALTSLLPYPQQSQTVNNLLSQFTNPQFVQHPNAIATQLPSQQQQQQQTVSTIQNKHGDQRARRKPNSEPRYILRITKIECDTENCEPANVRPTFYLEMPDPNNPSSELWKISFRCNLSDTPEDIKLFQDSGYTPANKEIEHAAKEAVLRLLDCMRVDVNSITLNQDYVFYPLITDSLNNQPVEIADAPSLHSGSSFLKDSSAVNNLLGSRSSQVSNSSGANVPLGNMQFVNANPPNPGTNVGMISSNWEEVHPISVTEPGRTDDDDFSEISRPLSPTEGANGLLLLPSMYPPVDNIDQLNHESSVGSQTLSYFTASSCADQPVHRHFEANSTVDNLDETGSLITHQNLFIPSNQQQNALPMNLNFVNDLISLATGHLEQSTVLPSKLHTGLEEVAPIDPSAFIGPAPTEPNEFNQLDSSNLVHAENAYQPCMPNVGLQQNQQMQQPILIPQACSTSNYNVHPNADCLVNLNLTVPAYLETVLKELVNQLCTAPCRCHVILPTLEPYESSSSKPFLPPTMRVEQIPEGSMFIGVSESRLNHPSSNELYTFKLPNRKMVMLLTDNKLDGKFQTPRIFSPPENAALVLTHTGKIELLERPGLVIPLHDLELGQVPSSPSSPHQDASSDPRYIQNVSSVYVRELPIPKNFDTCTFDDVLALLLALRDASHAQTHLQQTASLVSILETPTVHASDTKTLNIANMSESTCDAPSVESLSRRSSAAIVTHYQHVPNLQPSITTTTTVTQPYSNPILVSASAPQQRQQMVTQNNFQARTQLNPQFAVPNPTSNPNSGLPQSTLQSFNSPSLLQTQYSKYPSITNPYINIHQPILGKDNFVPNSSVTGRNPYAGVVGVINPQQTTQHPVPVNQLIRNVQDPSQTACSQPQFSASLASQIQTTTQLPIRQSCTLPVKDLQNQQQQVAPVQYTTQQLLQILAALNQLQPPDQLCNSLPQILSQLLKQPNINTVPCNPVAISTSTAPTTTTTTTTTTGCAVTGPNVGVMRRPRQVSPPMCITTSTRPTFNSQMTASSTRSSVITPPVPHTISQSLSNCATSVNSLPTLLGRILATAANNADWTKTSELLKPELGNNPLHSGRLNTTPATEPRAESLPIPPIAKVSTNVLPNSNVKLSAPYTSQQATLQKNSMPNVTKPLSAVSQPQEFIAPSPLLGALPPNNFNYLNQIVPDLHTALRLIQQNPDASNSNPSLEIQSKIKTALQHLQRQQQALTQPATQNEGTNRLNQYTPQNFARPTALGVKAPIAVPLNLGSVNQPATGTVPSVSPINIPSQTAPTDCSRREQIRSNKPGEPVPVASKFTVVPAKLNDNDDEGFEKEITDPTTLAQPAKFTSITDSQLFQVPPPRPPRQQRDPVNATGNVHVNSVTNVPNTTTSLPATGREGVVGKFTVEDSVINKQVKQIQNQQATVPANVPPSVITTSHRTGTNPTLP